jgi:hypothetical protein
MYGDELRNERSGRGHHMPQTTPVEKPLMAKEQILALIGGLQDLHDLRLMYVGLFSGPSC